MSFLFPSRSKPRKPLSASRRKALEAQAASLEARLEKRLTEADAIRWKLAQVKRKLLKGE